MSRTGPPADPDRPPSADATRGAPEPSEPAASPAADEPGVLREAVAEAFDFDAALPRTVWHLLSRPAGVVRAVIDRRDGYVRPWRLYFATLGVYVLVSSLIAAARGVPDDPFGFGLNDAEPLKDLFRQLGRDPDAAEESFRTRTAALMPVTMACVYVPAAGLMRLCSSRPYREHLLFLIVSHNAAMVAALLATPLWFLGGGAYYAAFVAAGITYVLWPFVHVYRGRRWWRTAARFAALEVALLVLSVAASAPMSAAVMLSVIAFP